MADNDEAWLEALRSDGASGADAASRAEAERMRAAMLASRAAIPTLPDVDVEAALRRFREAAVSEGLLDRTPVESSPVTPAAVATTRGGAGAPRRRTQWWAGLSALIAALGAMLYIGMGPTLVGTRGGETLPPIYSADPRAAATALRDELSAAGVRVEEDASPDAGGVVRLEIDLGTASRSDEAIERILVKHRVPRASGARFTVEFVPSKAP